MGTAALKETRKKLRDKLSDIGPGLLFDRTDRSLQKRRLKTGKGHAIMTIAKYEEAITEQSRRIIESDEILKPFLEKIDDLNHQLRQLQYIRADHKLKLEGKDCKHDAVPN
jgi:hypothetical protein